MPRFTALTSKGLRDALGQELIDLGFEGVKPNSSAIDFSTNWEGCYKANACSRIATRILYPILDFPAYQADELYHNIKKHDFTQYIEPFQTLIVDSTVDQSSFRDSRFVSLKVKDAIVDQFREKHGSRPSIDKEADLRVVVRIFKNQVSVAIDTSGRSLSRRGYREDQGVAPLREHMAAGLLRLSGWEPGIPLVDPMCGSGTFLIEAQLLQNAILPSSGYPNFSFCNFKKFKTRAWPNLESPPCENQSSLWGFDKNPLMISIARKNQSSVSVPKEIDFRVGDAASIKRPCKENGFLIVNPPFGERLDDVDLLKPVYEKFAANLKAEFSGWTLWLLSGNSELTNALKMKANARHKVSNGAIDCVFLKYEIR